jgi:hypothetical protein
MESLADHPSGNLNRMEAKDENSREAAVNPTVLEHCVTNKRSYDPSSWHNYIFE